VSIILAKPIQKICQLSIFLKIMDKSIIFKARWVKLSTKTETLRAKGQFSLKTTRDSL